MARTTANGGGISQNSAGYYRRYLGKVKDETGNISPLHVSYSRDLSQSRRMDDQWNTLRVRLAARAGVPVASYVWRAADVREAKLLIAEMEKQLRVYTDSQLAVGKIKHASLLLDTVHQRIAAVAMGLGDTLTQYPMVKASDVGNAIDLLNKEAAETGAVA